MDFILPSDDTMELMREEFAKLKKESFARAFALANNERNETDNEAEEACGSACKEVCEIKTDGVRGVYLSPAVATALLLLYFVKHLSYNISYGTQIFNTHRGMEQIRPSERNFGQLNNLD